MIQTLIRDVPHLWDPQIRRGVPILWQPFSFHLFQFPLQSLVIPSLFCTSDYHLKLSLGAVLKDQYMLRSIRDERVEVRDVRRQREVDRYPDSSEMSTHRRLH